MPRMTVSDFNEMMDAREDLAIVLHVIQPANVVIAVPGEWLNACGRTLWDDYPPARYDDPLTKGRAA